MQQIRLEQTQPEEAASREHGNVDVAEALRALSRPRLTGSAESFAVLSDLRDRFMRLGYEVTDVPFTFSTWPGRFGVSVAGGVYAIGALTSAIVLHLGHPGVALTTLLLTLLLCGGIAVMVKPLIRWLPWGRVQGVNLVARKTGTRPKFLMMAHRDSKSQPVPLSFRGPAIAVAIVAWIAMVASCLFILLDPVFYASRLIVGAGTFAFLSGLVLVFCWVDNRSPGTLDNASGVVTLLGVAEQQGEVGDVAFVITDAEELGLAGARAIAPTLPPSFGLINVDGVDDEGNFYVIERFGWPKKSGAAPHLAAALLSAADQLQLPARRRDLPFGMLLDHIPVTQAGTPAVTLMRGTFASLRRVHLPSDNLDRMSGHGIQQAVHLISGALQFLRHQSEPRS